MKRLLIVLAALAALVIPVTAMAHEAGRWIPGTPYMIAESDASDLLERTYDYAYCSGIPRFGHQGEFPYEEFLYFDCTTKLDRNFCSDVRYRSVKASRRGYFQLRLVRKGDCF